MKWKNPVQTRAAVAQSAPSCIPGFVTKVPQPLARSPRNIRSNNRNIMTSSIALGKIIGRDFKAQQLVTTLTSSQDENPVSVVSIVGVGGIGKTALAQHVYNDTRITENFNVRMWISVTHLFDELRITKEMLESASSSRLGMMAQ